MLNISSVVRPVADNRDKSTEILAAVGAGMLPATVAMLMPIVLGRKRRSIYMQIPSAVVTPAMQRAIYQL